MKKFLASPLGRVVRGALAAALATVFTGLLAGVTSLPVEPVWIPAITGVIMGVEKFLRDHGFMTDPTTS